MRPTLELGVVVKAHGLRGAVRVQLHNPDSTTLEGVKQLLMVQGSEQRQVQSRFLGASSGAVILELDGVTDRDAAEALRGARLLIDRDSLPVLEEDQVYCQDLLGCRVEDEQGQPLGVVAEVFNAGASDVLVVRDGEMERLIPLVDDWVAEVDVGRRCIRIRGAEQFEPTRS
jgi:16S rRNA processing protein RimM